VRLVRILGGLALALPAMGEAGEPFSLLGISAGKNGASLSVPMQIVILLTLMTLLPAANWYGGVAASASRFISPSGAVKR